MKKKYKAMRVVSVALTTAFISVNGVGIIKSNATTTGGTYDGATTQYDRGNTRVVLTETSESIDESNYGEWIIEREPTYEEDGLKKREYTAPDGTFYVQYETIPKLQVAPVPPDSIDPMLPDSGVVPTPPLDPTPLPDNQNTATRSNSSKSFGHKSLGKKKRIENFDIVKKDGTTYQGSNDNSGSKKSDRKTDEEGTKSEVSKSENTRQYESQTNSVSARKSAAPENRRNTSHNENEGESRIQDNNITDSTAENNVETSLLETTENTTETNNKNEIPNENIEASQNSGENTETNTSELDVSDKSFNRYDGATLLAAGAYAWWIAIVLLPMINAVKWINKKRREKLRGNVNKKYN